MCMLPGCVGVYSGTGGSDAGVLGLWAWGACWYYLIVSARRHAGVWYHGSIGQCLELPAQRQLVHLGTQVLIHDLTCVVECCRVW
jgi:hypothetical protein